MWDSTRNRQRTRPKPAAAALAALLSILKTKELRLGSYEEVVNVRIPRQKIYDPIAKKLITQKNVMVELTSARVNCLADIPIIHLGYHAQRYGKVAVGFHRDSAIRHGFSPILYSLYDAAFLRSTNRGFAALGAIDLDSVTDEAFHIRTEMEEAKCEHGHQVESDSWGSAQNIDTYADEIERSVDKAKSAFKRLLAFIKTFEHDEFNSIYCEREWRSVSNFKFTQDDLAMIVAPKRIGRRRYFDEVIAQARTKLNLTRKIPIVPWEDLIEH